jgi:hypothetical protein
LRAYSPEVLGAGVPSRPRSALALGHPSTSASGSRTSSKRKASTAVGLGSAVGSGGGGDPANGRRQKKLFFT